MAAFKALRQVMGLPKRDMCAYCYRPDEHTHDFACKHVRPFFGRQSRAHMEEAARLNEQGNWEAAKQQLELAVQVYCCNRQDALGLHVTSHLGFIVSSVFSCYYFA